MKIMNTFLMTGLLTIMGASYAQVVSADALPKMDQTQQDTQLACNSIDPRRCGKE